MSVNRHWTNVAILLLTTAGSGCGSGSGGGSTPFVPTPDPWIEIAEPDPAAAFRTPFETVLVRGTASSNATVGRETSRSSFRRIETSTDPNGAMGWSTEIRLERGENRIKFRAYYNWDRSAVSWLVLYYDPAPYIRITSPAGSPAFLPGPVATLEGTVSASAPLLTVSWQNETTGVSGTAGGGENWTALVPRVPGPNSILVTAEDANGLKGRAFILVTDVVDLAGPSISILNPPAPSSSDPTWTATTSNMLELSGTTQDDIRVAWVEWSVSVLTLPGSLVYIRGFATGTVEWTAVIPLAPYAFNSVTLSAVDAGGNRTSVSRLVYCRPQ